MRKILFLKFPKVDFLERIKWGRTNLNCAAQKVFTQHIKVKYSTKYQILYATITLWQIQCEFLTTWPQFNRIRMHLCAILKDRAKQVINWWIIRQTFRHTFTQTRIQIIHQVSWVLQRISIKSLPRRVLKNSSPKLLRKHIRIKIRKFLIGTC